MRAQWPRQTWKRQSRPQAPSSAAASCSAAAPSAPRSATACAGSATINGVARQPEAQTRLFTIFFTTVGLCEAMYFINLAFMALFVFVFGKSV